MDEMQRRVNGQALDTMGEARIVVDHRKCTGCRGCEVICAVAHTGECNPSRARIHVVKFEDMAVDLPVMCAHCAVPLCLSVCPIEGANRRDPATGAMLVDHERCIGCRYCVLVCPFGAIGLDGPTGRIIKCDLCDGDPQCVRWCAQGALTYVRMEAIGAAERRRAVQRMAAALAHPGGPVDGEPAA